MAQFMALELARHKDIQQRVIDEVKSVDGPIAYDQARKLEFVNQCVSDIYPPFALLNL